MKSRKRDTDAFSIAFLDVITCGFGAIILLLMIAKTGDTPILETSVRNLQGIVRELQVQLFEIRGEVKILNRDLNTKEEQISIWDERIAKLQSELVRKKIVYNSIRDDSKVNAVIKGEYQTALQELTEEMKRLLARQTRKQTDIIGGIPVDSEYVIFIIDTSGSMVNNHWNRMIDQLITTLDVYPQLKGMQIMSDMGDYMFSQYRGRWIPDTKGRRKVIINTLRTWRTFSNSNPAEGITAAIRSFYDPKKKISIYVYGDEFPGRSYEEVLDIVDRINPKNPDGRPRVRIHAVGFPVGRNAHPQYYVTNSRFAALMRELTFRNGGTFVGLN